MIIPSALNIVIIGLSTMIFTFLWRMCAAHFSERPIGQAMATII